MSKRFRNNFKERKSNESVKTFESKFLEGFDKLRLIDKNTLFLTGRVDSWNF